MKNNKFETLSKKELLNTNGGGKVIGTILHSFILFMLYSYSPFSNSRTTNLGEDIGFCPVLGSVLAFYSTIPLTTSLRTLKLPKLTPAGKNRPSGATPGEFA
ncbi:hypothetical protein DN392_28785 [Bacillus sp. BB51/4]|uniref:hypothetical protein n=1 Tax=Bacillus sp. BB51/4 TaxID=2217819 RepID=UPI0011ED0233|nr:hypothetical protein [Bacillus sp. BB51/4]KAA0767995.1 hypothetical protein DN392_28785 [Bacillus sp. BB51/4]